MDWKTDPYFKKIRQDFIDSFPARARALESALQEKKINEIVLLVHKIAGVAASYGFVEMGEIAAEIEDLHEDGAGNTIIVEKVRALIRLLVSA